MKTLLVECGEALYGPRWQTSLAEALDVHDRTMRRWVASGEYPESVNADLLRLIEERGPILAQLRARLMAMD